MADDTLETPPVFEDTPHLGMPLPHPANKLEVDIGRLRQALGMIDQMAENMGLAIDASASREALQALARATGDSIDQLQQSTGQALAQMGQQIDQLADDIESKSVNLQAVAQASDAQQAREGVGKIKRLVQEAANSSTNGAPLVAGVEYTLLADAAYSRPLPADAQLGDSIRLRDPTGEWKLGRITIARSDPAYTINGRAGDVLINVNAWSIVLTYAGNKNWTLTRG